MEELEDEIFKYINEKLFTQEKPVMFTDLIFQFKIGPSRSKKIMYSYYKQNTVSSFNCIIVTCHDNGVIRVVKDINNVQDEASIIDCFIYAFNPMEKFIAINTLIEQLDCLTIRNPFKLNTVRERPNTADNKPTPKISIPIARSNTVPAKTENKRELNNVTAKPKKSGELRSTAILAKMRAERENKEAQRLEELKRRRQKQQKSDPKKTAQMKDLESLFDEEEDLMEDVPTPKKQDSTPIDKKELEELLETTAEESVIASQPPLEDPKPAKQEEKQGLKNNPSTDVEENAVSSYVDEDGFIVTNRAVTSTPPPSSRKRPLKPASNATSKKKTSTIGKKTQGTLESFFKKSKK